MQDTWVSVKCEKRVRRSRSSSEPLALTEQRVIAPSKDQLAIYWSRVAHRALEHLARRPLELMRFPSGPLPVLPESVHLLRPRGFMGDTILPVWIEDLDGLLGLVSIGAIELHPWNCTIDDMDHPDIMVFDLEGIEWSAVTRTALTLRDALAADGLKSWPTLTGTNGIQVMVSFESRVTYDLAQRYSAAVAERVMARDADKNDQLFIHTGGNYRSRTSIGPYSPRARPGFPIAAPVSWRRIERGVRADAFAITHPFHAF
jgi:bifunctional non-homologous end joining protein LigD